MSEQMPPWSETFMTFMSTLQQRCLYCITRSIFISKFILLFTFYSFWGPQTQWLHNDLWTWEWTCTIKPYSSMTQVHRGSSAVYREGRAAIWQSEGCRFDFCHVSDKVSLGKTTNPNFLLTRWLVPCTVDSSLKLRFEACIIFRKSRDQWETRPRFVSNHLIGLASPTSFALCYKFRVVDMTKQTHTLTRGLS